MYSYASRIEPRDRWPSSLTSERSS